MGKVDDMRAMREARYAERQTPAASKSVKRRLEIAADAVSAVVQPAHVDELCGHRSVGNKSCTREKGHVEAGTKNHRYK